MSTFFTATPEEDPKPAKLHYWSTCDEAIQQAKADHATTGLPYYVNEWHRGTYRPTLVARIPGGK